jgi:transcriptional regulator with XRE-family HTH domain
MNVKTYREAKQLTQEELAKASGVSVRTIQRIEAGQAPKGHTAKVLAKALGIELTQITQTQTIANKVTQLKLINLAPLFVLSIPLLNFILPIAITAYHKQFNNITRQLITLQILWSILSMLSFFILAYLKMTFSLSHRLLPAFMLVLFISNLIIIVKNAISLEQHQQLCIKLNFSLL